MITKEDTERVWTEFYNITSIPRPSRKEEKIRTHLLNWAKDNNLEAETDEAGNVLIRCEANGSTSQKTVLLQAHMDMVCEKDDNKRHDFEKDGIKVIKDGEWLKADGTTLGADDGIGIAMILAVAGSASIRHPKLECLFTVDEETGLYGANNIKANWLKATKLINLDSEEEGEFCIGCAGGRDTLATLKYTAEEMPEGMFVVKLTIDGLKGGHSGEDINKGRGNAIKIMAGFIKELQTDINELRLVNINGGNLRNAIPRSATAVIAIPMKYKEQARIKVNLYQKTQTTNDIKEDYNLDIESDIDNRYEVMPKSVSDKLIDSLNACPHGVIKMSKEIDGLVETSTNLAAIHTFNDTVFIETSQRSSVEKEKENASETVGKALGTTGATITFGKDYPGWEPNFNSELVEDCRKAFISLYGRKPIIKVIHAGLECGVILKKYNDMDMISLGPTLEGVHSPSERVNIPSVERTFELLGNILERIG